MRRRISLLASTALSAIMAVAIPHVASGQRVTTAAPSSLDSLAAQLVELELQKVASTVSPDPKVGTPRDVSSQIAALHERLRALPEGVAADREGTNRVVLALDARASSVQARLQHLRLFYTDTNPIVRQSVLEERAIDQRLAEIRTAK